MKDLNSSAMFSSYERVGRWITTWLHYQETIIFQGKLFQVHMPVSRPTHGKRNLPGLLFLTKKVVMEDTSQGFFHLAIVYTVDPSVLVMGRKIPNCYRGNPNYLLRTSSSIRV